MDLNLQTVELQLRTQPSTPSEVREQRTTVVITAIAAVDSAVAYYMQLFEQSFKVLTTLQEDPKVECLKTEACELQQRYDKVKWTSQMVSLTQRLARMLEAKELKEQMDVARHKEAVLKVRL